MANSKVNTLIKLAEGARITDLTSAGLFRILQRKGKAIRDDGHWFLERRVAEEIAQARHILGIGRKSAEAAVQRDDERASASNI